MLGLTTTILGLETVRQSGTIEFATVTNYATAVQNPDIVTTRGPCSIQRIS